MQPIRLHGQASCIPAVAWSADGELAIGVGDRVDILTPRVSLADQSPGTATISFFPDRTNQDGREPNSAPAHHPAAATPYSSTIPPPFDPPFSLPTSLFTSRDRPILLPPLSFARWSAQEELSRSPATSLEWSPPGTMGDTGRCALAVLTGNMVLSIWGLAEANPGQSMSAKEGTSADIVGLSPPTGAGVWRRVGVVNRELERFVVEESRAASAAATAAASATAVVAATPNLLAQQDEDEEGMSRFDYERMNNAFPAGALSTREREERIIRVRVRAFAWLPQLEDGRRDSDRLCLVVNDWGEAFVLSFCHGRAGRPLAIVSRTQFQAGKGPHAHLLEDELSRAGVRRVAVAGRWERAAGACAGGSGSEWVVRIAMVTSAEVFFGAVATGGDGAVGIELDGRWSPSAAGATDLALGVGGMLLWGGSGGDGRPFLVVGGRGAIYCLSWAAGAGGEAGPGPSVSSYPLSAATGFGWDEPVDGIVVSPSSSSSSSSSPSPSPSLHFVTQLLSRLDTPVLALPSLEPVAQPGGRLTSWQAALARQRHSFCRHNGLPPDPDPDPELEPDTGAGVGAGLGAGPRTTTASLVLSKVFALAPSPARDFVAVCTSLHPARGLEYANKADENVFVLVVPLGNATGTGAVVEMETDGGAEISAARRFGSAEYVAFSVRTSVLLLSDKSERDGVQVSRARLGAAVRSIWDSQTDFGWSEPSTVKESQLLRDAIQTRSLARIRFCSVVGRVLSNSGFEQDSIQSLFRHALPATPAASAAAEEEAGDGADLSTTSAVIIRAYVTAVNRLCEAGQVRLETDLDRTIAALFGTIAQSLSAADQRRQQQQQQQQKEQDRRQQDQQSQTDPPPSCFTDPALATADPDPAAPPIDPALAAASAAADTSGPAAGAAETESTAPVAESTAPVAPAGPESCTFCAAPIALEHLSVARCGRGHQFVRCAFTFLAIQAPGTARRCGLCGTVYGRPKELDQSPAQGDPSGGASAAGAAAGVQEGGKRRLFTVMADAVKVCLHCGGKFEV